MEIASTGRALARAQPGAVVVVEVQEAGRNEEGADETPDVHDQVTLVISWMLAWLGAGWVGGLVTMVIPNCWDGLVIRWEGVFLFFWVIHGC